MRPSIRYIDVSEILLVTVPLSLWLDYMLWSRPWWLEV